MATLNNLKEDILRNALFISSLAIPTGLQRKIGCTLATVSLATFEASTFVDP